MAQEDPFQRLNQEFYATEPSTYFRDRLKLLAVRAVRTDALASVLAEELVWGQIRIRPGDSEDAAEDDPAAERKHEAERQRFVVTESQILLHHVSETLLRMFLAHEGRPECPWLRMSALLDFKEFRAEVEELARPTWPQDRIDAVSDVFLGGVPVEDPPSGWLERRDAAVRLVQLLARRLQADKNLYNSAKHGLTSLAGEGSLHVYSESWEPVVGVEGVNVAFLEREGSKKSGFTWYHKTQWVNPEQAAWLANLAISQMEALWTIAKWHYLDQEPTDLRLVTKEAIHAATTGFPRNGPIESFRRSVARETVTSPARVE